MAKQLEFKRVKGWGGKRRGAGRPNLTGQVSHAKRTNVSLKTPLHLTMKLKSGVSNIRNQKLLKEFKKCTRRAKAFGLYVNHFSLLRNHIHLIAEARDNKSLSRVMKSLCGKFGKALGGPSFKGRYHLHSIKGAREMKNALEYVLLNKAKHDKLLGYVDVFSSAGFFDGWKWLAGDNPLLQRHVGREKDREFPDYLSVPKSWLGRVGWQRAIP